MKRIGKWLRNALPWLAATRSLRSGALAWQTRKAFLAAFAPAILLCTMGNSNLRAGPETALENEWTPSKSEGPGVVEQSLEKALQSAKPLKSTESPQSDPPAKAEFSLPSAVPSLNLNSNTLGEPQTSPSGTVAPADAPSIEPPAAANFLFQTDHTRNHKQLEDPTMNRVRTTLAAIVGAALLAVPANAEDPKTDLNEAVKKIEAAVK